MDIGWFWAVSAHSTTMNVLHSYDHGPMHWARVAKAGKALGQDTPNADLKVIEFFALFHDSMRLNEHHDPNHGERGWMLAVKLGIHHELSARQAEILREACYLHDKGLTSEEPTVGVCFDADRLDLGRVGIEPDNAYMSTAAGKRLNSARKEFA